MSTGVVWIIVFAFIAWNLVSLWLVFAKAKRPGWLALIPIVNVIVLLRIADRSPFNILLFFIPVVSWIASFVMWIAVAKTFGRSAWFGVGLTLLTPIFLPILGFGRAQYIADPWDREDGYAASW